MTKKEVFVGVRGFGVGGDVRVATTLKGICEAIGVSYSTAKTKGDVGSEAWKRGVWLSEGGKTREELMLAWVVVRVEVIRVRGRGAGGDRSNLVPRGTGRGKSLPGGSLGE